MSVTLVITKALDDRFEEVNDETLIGQLKALLTDDPDAALDLLFTGASIEVRRS